MSAAELAEFLRARLNEDERAARTAFPAPWIRHDKVAGVHADDSTPERTYGTAVADCRRVRDGYGVPNADHIARWGPARVLAEVDAKRRILAECSYWYDKVNASATEKHPMPNLAERFEVAMPVLALLPLPYADHPDYREDWRP